MKDYLSVIRSSQLFSGVSEEEVIAMLSCLKAEQKDFEGCFPAARRRYGGIHWSCAVGKRSGHTGGYLGNRNILSIAEPGQTFAAAFACAPGSRLNVSVVAETPLPQCF